MIPSNGTAHYSRTEDGGYKLIVKIDPDIATFARALVPKAYRIQGQRYPPHISVIRKEIPTNLDKWDAHEGEAVDFTYDPVVHDDERYYWIHCYSERLHEIRVELGLPRSSAYTVPPQERNRPIYECFHATVGNTKWRDFELDGVIHMRGENRCCSPSGRKVCRCGGAVHYTGAYSGMLYQCEDCGSDW